MARDLHVLLVEDSAADAELVLRGLRQAGFAPRWKRVETETDYLAALGEGYELILSDYRLPQFTGLRALQLLRESRADIPFIIVSGTIGEETAVLAMKSGATDYLLKDRLARLEQCVSQALEASRLRADRRRAEEQLMLQSTALATIANAVVITDPTGIMLWVNAAFTRLTGYTSAEAIGQSTRLLRSGEHDAAFYRDLWSTILAGRTWRGHFTNRRKDGTLYFDEHTITPVVSAEGAVTHFVAIMNDVTERKRAEAAMERHEQLLRLFVENSPASIAMFDREMRLIVTSRRYCSDYGLTETSLAGRSYYELFPGEADRWREIHRRCLAGATERADDDVFHRADGRVDWIRWEIRPWVETRGKIGGLIFFSEVITERKQVELALRDATERLQLAVRSAHVGLWDWDLRTNAIIFSPEWKRLLGCAEHEIANEYGEWEKRIHPDDLSGALAHLQQQFVGEGGAFEAEFRMRHRDGSWRWFFSRGEAQHDAQGKPARLIGCMMDITERKKLEEQFLHAQRMEAIGTLASGMAHDLNNILAPSLMVAGLLKARFPSAQDQQLLEMIETGAKRGASLIRQLLMFSRGATGARVPVQFRHLLKEMAEIMRETFPREITVVDELPGGVWPVMGDATQLHQVLMNLCVNARDAMPAGGELSIGVENFEIDAASVHLHPDAKVGRYVRVAVADTGQGIPPEVMKRIFDPFFTTKEIGKGTGLGLSTVLGIVKGHGGFLTVDSEPGHGSTFRVYLPAAERAVDERPAPPPGDPAALRGRGELILVVDDEAHVGAATRLLLERQNYRVLTASQGREAVALFLAHQDSVQLVLTDVMMPVMGGVALVRALRIIKPDLPVIATTGLDQPERLKELSDLGVTEILLKPCLPRDLLTALRKQLDQG